MTDLRPSRQGVRRWTCGGLVASSPRPVTAGIALLVILVLGVANFNVLITGAPDAPTDTVTLVLLLLLLASAVVGHVVEAVLKRSRPDVYATIGERTPTEEAERVV
jgi:hypothetical protein